MDERLLHDTTSLCRTCKNAVSARVVAGADGAVWMRKRCAAHGPEDVKLSDDAAWYEATRAITPTPAPPRHMPQPVHHGCPFDCGACASHEQKVRLPVVTITSACNLDCPICYVHNKNEGAFNMGTEEFRRVLGHLRAEQGGDVDLINFTGGEPTLHPQFLEFLEIARDSGVHRVSICTNGIRLAREEDLVKRLAELGARIALSFDTFDPHVDYELQGAHLLDLKLRCLDLLEKYDVDTTLIPVMSRGLNDHEIGRIVDEALKRRNVRHVEVHTITFTGQGGVGFRRDTRISMHEVLRRIEETTLGLLRPADFVPSPCAHPLCYQIAYLLLDPDGGAPIPFTRFVSRETLYGCLSEHLYLEPTPRLEEGLREAIDRLWTDGEEGEETERALRILRRALDTMFPTDRQISREEALRLGERAAKAVYVHSHMDEENFDVERVMQCCDSNCYADGKSIPVCSYNVLYREKEARFTVAPREWNERAGGRRPVSLPLARG